MADQKADLTLGFKTDQQKLAATQKNIASLRAGITGLVAQQKALGLSADNAGKGYVKLSGHAALVRERLLANTRVVRDQIAELKRLKTAQDQTSGGGGSGSLRRVGSTTAAIGGVLGSAGLGDIGGVTSQLGRVTSVVSQLQAVSGSSVGPISAFVGSVASAAIAAPLAGVAVIALAIAIKKFTDDLEAGKQQVEDALAAQELYFKVLHEGTTQSIKDQIAALKVKQAIEQDAFNAQVASAKAAREGTPIFGALGVALSSLPKHIQDNKAAIQQDQFQIDALTRALGTNAVAANDAKAALEKQTEAAKKQADDQKQAIRAASDAIKQARQQAADKETQIIQQAADQRIAIARRTAQQEQDAYTGLQRSLAEDRLKLGEVQADAQLNFQRDEAQSSKDHLKSLLKIRKDSQKDEFELQLQRDFAGIAKLRRDTEARLDEEDDRYTEERRQRLTALKNQLGDQQKAFIREREQRIRQYTQQLLDIRATKERELKLNHEAAVLDLQRLRAALTAELAMKQDAYTLAVQMAANALNRIKALSGEKTTTQFNANQGHESQGPGLGGYASGGYPPLGKWSSVNERPGQRESVSSGGQTVMLPGGMGLFKPLKSARVNPNGGGVTLNMPMNVQGSTWAEMSKRAHAMLDNKLSEAFEALIA